MDENRRDRFQVEFIGIGDGAGALVISSDKFAADRGLKPLGRLVSWGIAGVDPRIMGIGPVPASKQALAKANMSIDDIDLIEVNEAFAPQACAVERELKIPRDKLNRQGGDIGTQYRSAIFPHTPEQEAAARAAIGRARPDWPAPIVTTIEPLGDWYPAEDYHQDYWEGEGQRNPYCLAVIPPKLQKLRKSFATRLKANAAV